MTNLAKQTYALLRKVPRGRVTTYKALADALGVKAYRAIGQILKHNPDAPNTPCHRVVASDGTIGGFMGQSSGAAIQKKIQMLQNEGIKIKGGKILQFNHVLFTFPTS
ncbi:MGMT family protein [Candidatus Gottesmanbacteria bacterium]|nr:MGMT family protein [Candidatus Gottesmanbacteria bacterium]